MDKYLCIHGHFYQPPRENPWLEAIELQESAYPYHDWNERITDECYAPNAQSRILDGDGRIERITNNYARMSFNFGPTLLSWLEQHRPEVYAAILAADKESIGRFSGHGSAMAQGYGHIILPLANDRDRRTQVIWGIRDFERRFGRTPEGMWLPECAVSTPTLEALAEQGIKFTVLAPRQAARFRGVGAEQWIQGDGIDPSRAYVQRLPSGREIALFFYDGPVSRGIAFEHLLESGEKFAGRLMEAYDESRGGGPQLVHVATDGETYGHHHRHGDMALAYTLEHVERNGLARLTNYAEFLEKFPPKHEVQIVENSSWSCEHGVERWKADCGCNSGRAGWHQKWREPLRAALDWLRDALAPSYERAAGELLGDPWAARDGYIDVVLDRSDESVALFLGRYAGAKLGNEETVRALRLLEMQRQCMLMYTSCGWFFDEISGIETVQVIGYAARAIQLAREVLGEDLEPEFVRRLEGAPSNVEDRPNGRRVYEDFVKPAVVDLPKLAAHYAISSLFSNYPDKASVYAFDVEREDAHPAAAGKARALVGRATFTSRVTREKGRYSYGVLHLGGHVVNAGVRAFQGDDAYQQMVREVADTFGRAEYADTLRVMDHALPGAHYSLGTLFRDEQRRAVDKILEDTLRETEAAERQLYEHHAPLLRFLAANHMHAPDWLRSTAQFVLNAQLRRAIEAEHPEVEAIRSTLREAHEQGVDVDRALLGFALFVNLRRLAELYFADVRNEAALAELAGLVRFASELPFEVNLSPVQNRYYPAFQKVKGEGSSDAAWLDRFRELGRLLRIRVE